MQKLKDEALERARELVASQFMDPASLDDIGRMTLKAQKQLMTAEAQLNNTVNSKLDALKRGIDISAESNERLQMIQAKLALMDTRVGSTNTDISQFKNLCRLHFARDNLEKVRTQVDFLVKVPDSVQKLQAKLETQPDSLKEIYLEAVRLEALRDGLYDEINQHEKRSMSVVASGGTESGMSTDGGIINEDEIERIKAVLDEQLKDVPTLSKQIESALWSNIARLFDVATQAPQVLVETFVVIAMQEEYIQRRQRQRQSQSQSQTETSRSSSSQPLVPSSLGLGLRSLEQEARRRLQKYMNEKVESSFVYADQAREEADEDDLEAIDDEKERENGRRSREVESTLKAATELLKMLTIFKNEVAPCIPPHYDAIATFVSILEDKVMPIMVKLVEDNISVLEVCD